MRYAARRTGQQKGYSKKALGNLGAAILHSSIHGDSSPLIAQAGFGTVGTIHSSTKGTTIRHAIGKSVIPSIMTALATINQIATVIRKLAIAVIGGLNQNDRDR